MKFSKSEIKQIIKEEIEQYMDDILTTGVVDLEEAPQPLGIDLNTDDETLLKLLSQEIGKVPPENKKSVLTTLLNAVNNYVDRMARSGATPSGPIQREHIEAVILEMLREQK